MGFSAHIRSIELHDLADRDQPAEDGLGDDCVVEGLVPVFGVELRGHDRCSPSFSAGEDVQDLRRRVHCDRCREEVIEDEDVTGPETVEELQPSGIRGLVDG